MKPFTAPDLSAPQYAMNPASRVFPPAPDEAPRAQLRPGRWRDELPVTILNADWRASVEVID